MLTETPRSVRRSEDGDQGLAAVEEPEVIYIHSHEIRPKKSHQVGNSGQNGRRGF